MIEIVFDFEAEQELLSLVEFYENSRAGLGDDFLDELSRMLSAITSHPSAGQPIAKNLRRRLVARFPVAVLYETFPRRIVVIALAHLRRRPGYWRARRARRRR